MRSTARKLKDERGATIALVAVSLAVILAMGAMTVDLGMLMKMRNDAQRVADAAALAGASAFLDYGPLFDPDVARDRALQYVDANYVGGSKVDTAGGSLDTTGAWTTNEARVQVVADSQLVRVTVRRSAVGSFFARLFDTTTATISARAAAAAVDAASSGCVMPFAIPDMWNEQTPGEDLTPNRVQDGAEEWTFDPTTDQYDSLATGYGSAFRNPPFGQGFTDDYGSPLTLEPKSPGDPTGPENFELWDFEVDPGGIEDRILDCDPRDVALGSDTNYVASGSGDDISNEVNELVQRDPGAYWDVSTNRIQGSAYADWRSSPRVVKIALYSPGQIATLGPNVNIKFNNIALVFLEDPPTPPPGGNPAAAAGRFLYYASGGSGGGSTGFLVKTLKLVQ